MRAMNSGTGRDATATPRRGKAKGAGRSAGKSFDRVADAALRAMRRRAEELKVRGVAVVAFVPGRETRSWISRMLTVGGKITGASKRDPKAGANCLGIAYMKAAEMADTKRDSGSGVRRPKVGECGWQGGVVARGKAGWLIAAFSGAVSSDDVLVSQAGLAVLQSGI